MALGDDVGNPVGEPATTGAALGAIGCKVGAPLPGLGFDVNGRLVGVNGTCGTLGGGPLGPQL